MELNPLEFMAAFLPGKLCSLGRTGVQIHSLQYWSDALEPYVGQKQKVMVHYDPRDISSVMARTPSGVLVNAQLTTPDVQAMSLAEWKSRRVHEQSFAWDPTMVAVRDESQKRADQGVEEAKVSRQVSRRKATEAAGDKYRTSPTPLSVETKDATDSDHGGDASLPSIDPQRTFFEVEGANDDE